MLAEMGYRVFCLVTDLGGDSGISGAMNYALKNNCRDKFNDLVTWWVAEDVSQFNKFVDNQNSVIENFWTEANPDFILFDGFSFWQQCQVMPEIEEAEGVENGFDNFKGWGKVKNSTIRGIQDVLLLRKPDGTPVHKIFTAALRVTSKPKPGGKPGESIMVDLHEPDISGAAKKMMKHGFDICWETMRNDKGEYSYHLKGDFCKKRIDTMPDILPAKFSEIWKLQQELWKNS